MSVCGRDRDFLNCEPHRDPCGVISIFCETHLHASCFRDSINAASHCWLCEVVGTRLELGKVMFLLRLKLHVDHSEHL